jgi:hypothetical protein
MQLHMAVKGLAIIQGEITSTLKEIIKKAELLQHNEELGEEVNNLLGMISYSLSELIDLFKHKNNLTLQIEKLRQIEMGFL